MRPPSIAPHLCHLLLLSACLFGQHVKIAFPKYATPEGWQPCNPANLSTPTAFGYIPTEVPGEFRSHVKGRQGFTYTTAVPPGRYIARLGFLENAPCKTGGRVFHFDVNHVDSGFIDLFQDAQGCAKSYTRDVGPLDAANGLVVLKAVPDQGWPPILSNVQLFKVGTTHDRNIRASPVSAPVSARPSEIRVAFSKNPPKGWTAFDLDKVSGNVIIVKGSREVQDELFRNQIKARGGFTYIQDIEPGNYDIELGFMELNARFGCAIGKRVFRAELNGIETDAIDVFASAGCRQKCHVFVSGVVVEDDGLEIVLKPLKGFAPFLANFVVLRAGELSEQGQIPVPKSLSSILPIQTLGAPSTAPRGYSIPDDKDQIPIEINTGTRTDENPPSGSFAHFFPGKVTAEDDAAIQLTYFKTSRYGKDFAYSFNLPAGAYDITLGFIENYSPHCQNQPGKRVFNVYVNGAIKIESYDIFDDVGCHRAVEHVIEHQTVSAVNTNPLTIRFEAVANNAVISLIRIEEAFEECVPVSTTGEILADHAAHAVPGSYPPLDGSNFSTSYVDSNGDGYEWVDIDGSGSHTHFFDSASNIIGRITDYIWTIAESGKVISRDVAFRYKFPLGTTRLKLAVVDSSCTTDEAETTVTVTGKIQPGQYCYYYSSLKAPPMGGIRSSPRPSFAYVSKSVDLGFPPFPFDEEDFAVRCHFFLEHEIESKESIITIDTGGTGTAKVYKGNDVILDMESSKAMTSVKTALAAGLTFFEVVYYRSGALDIEPKLTFVVDGLVPDNALISYDRTTVVPILTEIEPREGKVAGGTKVKLEGYGLFQPIRVTFGDEEAEVFPTDASPAQIFVSSPASTKSQVVGITATAASGLESNMISYSYGHTSCDSVAFQEDEIVHVVREGKKEIRKSIDMQLSTCAVLSGDGLLYVGTLGGTVQVLGYDRETLIAESRCYSEVLRDPKFTKSDGTLSTRDILGITFDPRDDPPRPYISTNTLYWREREMIDLNNPASWSNGAVDRLVHNGTTSYPVESPGLCLVYDKRIVSGLPVSNHDHGINGLLFTQSGDLLISVGGFTNSGLPGYKLGGMWETFLSASIVIAKTSKPNFNGTIEYTHPKNPRLARVKNGDVELYATGLRNAFPITMKRTGEIWVTDQGPNCSFGDSASSCGEYREAVASKWNPDEEVDFQGRVKHGWADCLYGPGRKDKIVKIVEDGFYGHPNVIRGNDECKWIDPYTDLTSEGGPPTKRYRKPLTTVQSSVTGILEYGARHFCGELNGELIVSSYKGAKTYRIRAEEEGVEVETVHPTGGLSFVESADGNLIFPQLGTKKVSVLRPRVTKKAGVGLVGAHPWRHGATGGTVMTVSGWGFGDVVKVLVGGNGCAVTKKGETEIVCMAPSGAPGSLVSVSVETKGETVEIEKAVLYMLV